MAFIDVIKERARQDVKTIVLPESEDQRTLQAAQQILKEGTAKLVIIGNEAEILADAKKLDVSIAGSTIVDPLQCDKSQEYTNILYEARKAKGMTLEQAKDILSTDKLTFGVVMVKAGDADGMVAGACHSTADTLRPSLQILKTAPGTKTVSSFFIMEVPDCEYGDNGTFLFADCGLNQNPDATQLAEIATSSAASFKALTGKDALVALLSHSTVGSAKHEHIDKVVEAVKIAKATCPDVLLDGELQLDAAIVPSVGKLKAPDSPVAGCANCLIFPDLDAGNIGYKLVQRLAKADAFGPMLQGIAKPVNDLSRGCYAEDIVGVVAFTAVQAQMS